MDVDDLVKNDEDCVSIVGTFLVEVDVFLDVTVSLHQVIHLVYTEIFYTGLC